MRFLNSPRHSRERREERQPSEHGMHLFTGIRFEICRRRSDQQIHEQGLLSVLRQIHDDFDAAIADAYGWPADPSVGSGQAQPDDEMLRRLVAPNANPREEFQRPIDALPLIQHSTFIIQHSAFSFRPRHRRQAGRRQSQEGGKTPLAQDARRASPSESARPSPPGPGRRPPGSCASSSSRPRRRGSRSFWRRWRRWGRQGR